MKAYETQIGQLFDLEHVLVIGQIFSHPADGFTHAFQLTLAFNSKLTLYFTSEDVAKLEHANLQAAWLKYRLSLDGGARGSVSVAASPPQRPAPPVSAVRRESELPPVPQSPPDVGPIFGQPANEDAEVESLLLQAQREMEANAASTFSGRPQTAQLPTAPDQPYRSSFL